MIIDFRHLPADYSCSMSWLIEFELVNDILFTIENRKHEISFTFGRFDSLRTGCSCEFKLPYFMDSAETLGSYDQSVIPQLDFAR